MNVVRPMRVGKVWTRTEGDQTAVFDPSTGRLSQLNSSALAIWELCDGKTELEEMIDAVVELTRRSHDDVAHEVGHALDQLRTLGLISGESQTD